MRFSYETQTEYSLSLQPTEALGGPRHRTTLRPPASCLFRNGTPTRPRPQDETDEGLPKRVGTRCGPKAPHFYWPGRPAPKSWASPAPQTPHFYGRALGQPGPPRSLTFIAGPGRPDPSLLSVRADPVTPTRAALRARGVPPVRPPPVFTGKRPSTFGKHSDTFWRAKLS